jgi:orotate phosphoribosyltransferase-like protein
MARKRDIKKWQELRKRGMSFREIAYFYDVAPGTVYYSLMIERDKTHPTIDRWLRFSVKNICKK